MVVKKSFDYRQKTRWLRKKDREEMDRQAEMEAFAKLQHDTNIVMQFVPEIIVDVLDNKISNKRSKEEKDDI